MKYLLDTNICIYLIKSKPVQVLEKFLSQEIGEIGISAVTVAEMQYGVQKSQFPQQNQAALDKFLMPLSMLDFDLAAAEQYGKIHVTLEQKGIPIGAYDLMIAAQAVSQDVILVTNNVREFARIPGLRLENWAEG